MFPYPSRKKNVWWDFDDSMAASIKIEGNDSMENLHPSSKSPPSEIKSFLFCCSPEQSPDLSSPSSARSNPIISTSDLCSWDQPLDFLPGPPPSNLSPWTTYCFNQQLPDILTHFWPQTPKIGIYVWLRVCIAHFMDRREVIPHSLHTFTSRGNWICWRWQ